MAGEWWLGEIRAFPFEWAPQYWAVCDGALLQIVDNAPLFSLVGTKYGGDGRRTFALPDLRGLIPLGTGPSSSSGRIYRLGDKGGEAAVQLTELHLPAHSHPVQVRGTGGATEAPEGMVLSQERGGRKVYRKPAEQPVPLAPASLTDAGLGKPHNNLMPVLGLQYCIAVRGMFPPRP